VRNSRAHYPSQRSLTPDETARVERLIDSFWPGRPVARQYVESNQYMIIEWQPGSGPVTQVTLPLGQLEYSAPSPTSVAPARHLPGPGTPEDQVDTVNRKDSPDVQLSTAVSAR